MKRGILGYVVAGLAGAAAGGAAVIKILSKRSEEVASAPEGDSDYLAEVEDESPTEDAASSEEEG